MKDSVRSLPIYFNVKNEFSDKDDRFICVTIDVLHTGLNFNGSIFSKEVVDENIDTIKNTPILGYIRMLPDGEKDFKGHEYVITKTDENGFVRKYIGSAYGLIPESCNPRWINKICDDGQEREFLQVDGLLWTKFNDSSNIMTRDIEKPHSMELYQNNIEGYDDEDDNFVFTKFNFDGCCILGTDIEPAMINSNITINEVQFTMNDFVRNIQSELNDKYSTFTKIINDATFTKTVNEKTNQGGTEIMPNTEFSQTLLALFDDISAMVRQHETYTDKWGWECSRYYAVDVQENEVIVVDTKNNYNYFGLSFTMNGDRAEIDFESAKRKKLCYEDYVEGTVVPEGSFSFGAHIEEIKEFDFAKIEEANEKVSKAEVKASEFEAKASEFETAKNEIEEKYNHVNAEFEEMKPKYEEYVKAEEIREQEELDAKKDAEFAKYESALSDNTEFQALKEKKSEMTIKEIEVECSVLFTRENLAKTNFSINDNGTMTAGLINSGEYDSGVYMSNRYGCIPVKRNK